MHKHYIIGTAGHIDHGKTTLSKALTGKETDRLKEEKERNISIELGFAPFHLPNGDQVSLIDVPGHEKFIRHMVAGVGGIDLVLLIIAADEGVMPQTKEHLQIINLLGIEHGIIVVTKKDMVDEELLELVVEDIKDYVKETSLQGAPIVPVSGRTKEGIEELKSIIEMELTKIPERSFSGFFRMPIDRVFTLKGIGTVVTGTVYSGKLEVGQELEILPSNHKVRVRSLQVHSEDVNTAYAGQRVAINITGVDIDDIARGDSIVTLEHWEPSMRVDIELHIIEEIDFPIKHNSEVKFLIGTNEVVGTILLYDRKEALPGETVYCQVKLEEPIIASRKERFIIRRPSPATTIAGGFVIEPNAVKHKYRNETIENLKQKSKGTMDELILTQLVHANSPILTLNELSKQLTLPEEELKDKLSILLQSELIIDFQSKTEQFYAAKEKFVDLEKEMTNQLNNYHQQYTLRVGQPKAEFAKQFFPNVKPKLLQELLKYLENKHLLKVTEEFVSAYEFEPSLPNNLKEKANKLEKSLIDQRFTPDTWEELANHAGLNQKERIELFTYLQNKGSIYKLTDKLVIHKNTFLELKKLTEDFLNKEGQITLQDAKELLQVSRKFLVPLMELLDQEKVTVLRQGHNYRELRK